MSDLKKLEPMAVYHLLEFQMQVLAWALGIVAILCGIMAWYYGKQKAEAARFETSWIDTHKNVAAVRFGFHEGSKDLEYLNAILQIKIHSGPKQIEYDSVGIIGRESEIYLPVGIYDLEFTTREYEVSKFQLSISEDMIGKRVWPQINLRKPAELLSS